MTKLAPVARRDKDGSIGEDEVESPGVVDHGCGDEKEGEVKDGKGCSQFTDGTVPQWAPLL